MLVFFVQRDSERQKAVDVGLFYKAESLEQPTVAELISVGNRKFGSSLGWGNGNQAEPITLLVVDALYLRVLGVVEHV